MVQAVAASAESGTALTRPSCRAFAPSVHRRILCASSSSRWNVLTLVFRLHAVQRMAGRRISAADVRYVLDTGLTVETYPDDTPYPSRLVLGCLCF